MVALEEVGEGMDGEEDPEAKVEEIIFQMEIEEFHQLIMVNEIIFSFVFLLIFAETESTAQEMTFIFVVGRHFRT